MRFVVALIAGLLFSTAAFSSPDFTAIYSQKSGSSSLRVLRLRSDQVYEYITYTKKKATRDTGTYVLNRHRLVLTSTMKKHGANPWLRKSLFVNEKGLYSRRTDCWLKKRPQLPATTSDVQLQQSWLVNPLTGKTFQGTAAQAVPIPPAPVVPAAYVQPANAGELAKQFYISTAARYAKGYDEVLQTAYCGPDCYYEVINGKMESPVIDTAANQLFQHFETVMHESVHSYNRKGYLVVPGVYIEVPRTAAYKTSLFQPIVPADAKANIFRFATYVDTGSVVSANVSGIYGLLDEYSAYLNGVRSCLVGAQQALALGDTALAARFVSQTTGTHNAHYEFRLFIAWYMHYASLHEKTAYTATLANKPLRVTFTLLDDEFRNTLMALAAMKNTRGMQVCASIDTDYYQKKYTSYLSKQLLNEESWLTKLRVKGVTVANYKQYLK